MQNISTKNISTATKMTRIALYICAVLLFIKFITSLLLPTLVFSHNVRNTDPLFDLSTPSLVASSTTTPQTTFSASSQRSGDTITLTITTSNSNTKNLEGRPVYIHKTYRSWQQNTLSPRKKSNTQETDTKPFRSGTIVRSESEYFMIEDQTLRPIDRPETLLASGYNFDTTQVSTSRERSTYKKGKIFTMRDVHPNGTIFSTQENESEKRSKYYQKNGEALTEITQEDVANAQAPNQTISVALSDRTTAQTCILRKKFMSKKYSCKTDIGNIAHHTGKDYIFTIEDINPSVISNITARIAQSPKPSNIQSQISLILSKIRPK